MPTLPSSAIGEFVIGKSPIGVLPPALDFRLTIISQYQSQPPSVDLGSDMAPFGSGPFGAKPFGGVTSI